MESVKAYIDLFARGGWSMLKDHPIPSFLVFLLGIIFAHFYYQERINVFEERISSYQERLGEIPKETKYTGVTNKDLRKEAYRLANKLRDFHQEFMKDKSEQQRSLQIQKEAAQSDEQRQNLEQRYGQTLSDTLRQEEEQFQREFLTPTRALSTAIRERQPKYEKRFDDDVMEFILQTGVLAGPNAIAEIATNLEKRADQLPIPLGDWFSRRWQDTLFTVAVFIGVFFWALRQYALWYRPKPSPSISVPHETNSTVP